MTAVDSLWRDVVGHDDAVRVLQRAAEVTGEGDRGMTHSWLITGPPGSGRSTLAFAFAAALLNRPGEDDPHVSTLVRSRTHPDLMVLSTTGVIIDIESARDTVRRSALAPSLGRYRVIVVEDADRMTERTSNTLLKTLEEPPDQTVWILCAPSEADVLPTIRSRVRLVHLGMPSLEAVTALLVERDGVSRDLAEQVARQAQQHIGMARTLAGSADARDRRNETLTIATSIASTAQAVLGAARLLEIASADADALSDELDAEERRAALHQLGIAEGSPVPRAVQSQLRQLDDQQKRRRKRALVDGVDRICVDLQTLFRDLLLGLVHADRDLINQDRADQLAAMGQQWRATGVLAVLDDIQVARRRVAANVPPLLALEALLVRIARRGE